MFRPRVYGGLIALSTLGTTGLLGAGRMVSAESREPSRLLTEQEAAKKLLELHGQDEYTYYDLSELPALGEDGNCQGRVGPYLCWGIFDGHSGWSASNHVASHIVEYLNVAYEKRPQNTSWQWLWPARQPAGAAEAEPSSEEFDEIVGRAFMQLDNDMLQAPLKALKSGNAELAAAALPVASSGSCAMMAFYHPVRKLLKVALTGDSRTVLGVQDKQGVWHARSLTTDQTGGNPAEIARIRAEHPEDPPGIVRNGRVMGFQPSRSFGDAVVKYTKDEIAKLQGAFWMRSAPPASQSPPYLTAKPVVSTVTLDAARPAFMVLGCDGIYEWLSNEQLVALVGQWLEKNPVIPAAPYAGAVDHSTGYDSADFKRPEALGWGPLQPIVKDGNAASHIIRNALGGADFRKVSMLMSIPSPMARRYRDDMTCTVVFFVPTESPPSKL